MSPPFASLCAIHFWTPSFKNPYSFLIATFPLFQNYRSLHYLFRNLKICSLARCCMGHRFLAAKLRRIFFAAIKCDVHISYRLSKCYRISLRINFALIIFNESNQVFGARKINSALRSRGFKVADKTVASIMHENGWFSVRGGSKTIFEMNKQRKENILNQQFIANAPNEVWVGDITYFSCNSTKYFICVIIDLFARKVIAHSISTSNSTHITKKLLKKPIKNELLKKDWFFTVILVQIIRHARLCHTAKL